MLPQRLINLKLVTGPVPNTNTSNSSMGVIKNFLLGIKQFSGDETFLIFGRVLHEYLQHIENKYYVSPDFKLLTPQEQVWIYGCVKSVRNHFLCKRLIEKSTREVKHYVTIEEVLIALLLDVEQPHVSTGTDWKSTSCVSEQDFIKKALAYDYVRQGKLYKKARKLKHFYFIGIQKQPPHQIYIMDVSRYKDEELYAEQEIKFLAYFFKHYGKIVMTQPKKK